MNERIDEINRTLIDLRSKPADADEYLFSHLPGNVYEEVKTWMAHAFYLTDVKVRKRQQDKFARLVEKRSAEKKAKDGPIVDVNKEECDKIKK